MDETLVQLKVAWPSRSDLPGFAFLVTCLFLAILGLWGIFFK